VTIASRPSKEAGRGEFVEMICPTGKAKYFFSYDWTGKISLICLKKFRFRRKCRGNQKLVITGLDPVIHHPSKGASCEDGWMPGSSPGMTSGICGAS
jgi:hypothetical protein